MSQSSSNNRALVADIGGTRARFGLVEGGRLQRVEILPTGEFDCAASLLDAVDQRMSLVGVNACCLAVAGPVRHDRARLTNGRVEFVRDQLARRLTPHVVLVNDFVALARAVPDLENLRYLGDPRPSAESASRTRVVAGPGTGFGTAALVYRDGWHVISSEAGQGGLTPSNHLELELFGILLREYPVVSRERILSGNGLVVLYRAMCDVWGCAPQPHGPAQISASADGGADPVCAQTVGVFFSLLGSAAADLALTFDASGGVTLAGGVVQRLLNVAEAGALRRRFDEHLEAAAVLPPLPLSIVLDETPALHGALRLLQDARLIAA